MNTPKRAALVEAMCECVHGAWDEASESDKSYWRKRVGLALDAILNTEEECGECGGRGYVTKEVWSGSSLLSPVQGGRQLVPRSVTCSVCHGTKTVPGKPLIIEAAVEAGIDVVEALVKLGVLKSVATAWAPKTAEMFRRVSTQETP